MFRVQTSRKFELKGQLLRHLVSLGQLSESLSLPGISVGQQTVLRPSNAELKWLKFFQTITEKRADTAVTRRSKGKSRAVMQLR